jgi:dTDP-4-dehydrorhamnose reductase
LNPSRVLVLGASGQVGREAVQQALARGLDVRTAGRSGADSNRSFDLARPESACRIVKADAPDHVFLTAAPTSVVWCEMHPGESWALTVTATEAIASVCREVGSSLTFISTDYVFAGEFGPAGEEDPVGPLNVYGRHKLVAEMAVVRADPANLIVRTCQVFGVDPLSKNFVLQVADRLRAGEGLDAAGNLFGTPTYAPDLVRALLELRLTGESGIWHVAGETFLSRYALAIDVANAFGADASLVNKVIWDRSAEPVNRPLHAGLRNDRLSAKGMSSMTELSEALQILASGNQTR